MTPEEESMYNWYKAIAKVCHEANKAYCQTIGDYSQVSWEDAPEWQKESAVEGVRWRIENYDAPPSFQHEKWMEDKLADGWTYGAKDKDKKTHPCLVDWDELPADERLKDVLFTYVVRSLS